MPSNFEQPPATGLRDLTATLRTMAGYDAHNPLVVGVQQKGAAPAFLASGQSTAASR